MTIIVTDRQTIERGIVVRGTYAVISVTDPERPAARIPRASGCGAVLRLRFHDAEPFPGFRIPPNIIPTGGADAEQLARFVREHQGQVDVYVIHCEQGASRSPAIAAAIAEHLKLDPRPYWQQYVPNRYVYELVRGRLAT
ncbi:hypothetical protein ACERK3_14155 [Phycisphaerales bacterium AB-hyl4]|uniref:Dual specificity protein phosphatase-like protein n=1 Tax=Natronomicrosphaera hydrolytica TaxID=3242702 RepID=A0ABV4U763_9BACT